MSLDQVYNQNENEKRRLKPVNSYIGENFAVRLDSWIQFRNLITDREKGGIFHCVFRAIKEPMDWSLSAGAGKIMKVPNAGGNSIISEGLSFEMFMRCFGATLCKTEMEVTYFPKGGSMVDYVCHIFGNKIAVCVTRAMEYREKYTHKDAEELLSKKLKGILQSSSNSHEKWAKQILHVWAQNKHIANIVTQVYNRMHNVKSNTVVIVTTTYASNFIYQNRCTNIWLL